MATDWPGHASTNRHPHLPYGCRCQVYFTEHQDPPWAYRLGSLDENNPDVWKWTEHLHYAAIQRPSPKCEWAYSEFISLYANLWSLWFSTSELSPNIRVILQAAIAGGVQISAAENDIDSEVPIGNRIQRGTIWYFPHDNWRSIVQFPVDLGIPDVGIVATPVDCIPGWQWGDNIP